MIKSQQMITAVNSHQKVNTFQRCRRLDMSKRYKVIITTVFCLLRQQQKLPKTQQIATEYFVNDCRLHLSFFTFFFPSVLNSETSTILTKFLLGLEHKSISITGGVNGFVGKTETRKILINRENIIKRSFPFMVKT